MCVTLGPAHLSKTVLLAHALPDGRNVIGYQNHANNRQRGPNAMVLPFPSEHPMTRENCIDLSAHPKLFREYAEIVRPRERSSRMTKGARFLSAPEVFDSGSYTVVLAANAREIPSVLDAVPENKRPQLHPELFDAYAHWYPGWTVALCCWGGEIEAEPMLWWYEPTAPYRDAHFLPGLDGHDGRVPDPARKSVAVDHTIVVGAPQTTRGRPNAEGLLDGVRSDLRALLPDHVYGGVIERQMQNGDWVLPKTGWHYGNAMERVTMPREKPPGFGTT